MGDDAACYYDRDGYADDNDEGDASGVDDLDSDVCHGDDDDTDGHADDDRDGYDDCDYGDDDDNDCKNDGGYDGRSFSCVAPRPGGLSHGRLQSHVSLWASQARRGHVAM